MSAAKLQPGLGESLNICWLCGKFESLFGRNLVTWSIWRIWGRSIRCGNTQKSPISLKLNSPFCVCCFLAGIQAIHVLDEHDWCLLPKSGLLLHSLLCEYSFCRVCFLLIPTLFTSNNFFPTRLLLFSQAYADSDVDLFTWGTPITTIALFTILVHLGIETKTWVRKEADVKNSFVCVQVQVWIFSRCRPPAHEKVFELNVRDVRILLQWSCAQTAVGLIKV